MLGIKEIFLLDDEFPRVKEFIEKGIYDKAIDGNDLYHLALYENWGTLSYLQQLIKDITTSQPYKDGLLKLSGYSNPEQALYDIEKGSEPYVIIYDWQYGEINDVNSQNWLLELLEQSNAFIFIYSQVGDTLSQFLNKPILNKYSNKFQLFLKGSKSHSLFYSEEFILQYILNEIEPNGKIKVHGFEVEFCSNKYLKKASDLLYLDRVFGRINLLEKIREANFKIDDDSIVEILDDEHNFLFFSKEKGVIVSPDNHSDLNKISDSVKITFREVISQFSLKKLEEALERGLTFI